MSDLYIHHHLKPTLVQHDNLVELARHLITRSPLLRHYVRLVFSEYEDERAGKAEWAIEWTQMQAVTFYRGGR